MAKRKKNRRTGMPYSTSHLLYSTVLRLEKEYNRKGYKTDIYSILYENKKKYAKLWIYNK